MPIKAQNTEKKGFDAGVYDAVCYSVLDIGTQENKFGEKHQLVIGWKFLDHTYEDGNYVSYHQTYTLSMNEKAKLRELLSAWCPEEMKKPYDFDLVELLGKACKLILAPNANGTVQAKSAIPSNKTADVKTESFSFSDWDGGELPRFLTEDRNQWKRNRVVEAKEYEAIVAKNIEDSHNAKPKAQGEMIADTTEAPF